MKVLKRRRNGEGSYGYDSKQKRYWYACSYEDPVTGEHKRKYITSIDKGERDRKAKEWEEYIEKQHSPEAERITVGEWMDQFLSLVKPTIKAKTYENYESVIRVHLKPAFGNVLLKKLRKRQVQELLNKKAENLSAVSVASIRRVFNVILNYAVSEQLIVFNPAKAAKAPRIPRKLPVALNEEEMMRMFVMANYCTFLRPPTDDSSVYLRQCYFVALAVAVDSGLRKGEEFGLRWHSLNGNVLIIDRAVEVTIGRKVLGTPKNDDSVRRITLSNGTVRLLNKWKQAQQLYAEKWRGWFDNKEDLIFTDSKGGIVSYTNLYNRWWAPLKKAAELPEAFKWHGLRDTMCTYLVLQGAPLNAVSQRLGHADVALTVRRYLGAARDMQSEIAAMMDKWQDSVPLMLPASSDNKEDSGKK